MNGVLLADVLILAGLLTVLCLIGVLLGGRDERGGRMFALLLLAVALTITAAGRRHTNGGEHDLLAWTLAAVTLPRLWWPQRAPPGEAFATLSVVLGVGALVMTLMWGSR